LRSLQAGDTAGDFNMANDLYASGQYMEMNPSWHVEESAWKAQQVLRMLARHRLRPLTVAEVGCGAGEVLRQLQLAMDPGVAFSGYDISPQAIALCQSRANAALRFFQTDFTAEPYSTHFDLLLVMDVIEHLEDYYAFLRAIRPHASFTILHIPLELSVQTILRPSGLLNTQIAYGHLHYFSAETALAALGNAGYAVEDHVYTARAIEEPTTLIPRRLLKLPRRALFRLNKGLAARVLGGFGLLALVQNL
jgi:SAM-dependent methyltransferase